MFTQPPAILNVDAAVVLPWTRNVVLKAPVFNEATFEYDPWTNKFPVIVTFETKFELIYF